MNTCFLSRHFKVNPNLTGKKKLRGVSSSYLHKEIFKLKNYFSQIDIHTLKSLEQIWIWVKAILKNLKDYADDPSIVEKCQAIFGNIASRQLPLSKFEIDRLVDMIQFYRRWNSSSDYTRNRPEAQYLQSHILAALHWRGSYDKKCKQEVVENIKVVK